jgi:FkbM family methyltransferase
MIKRILKRVLPDGVRRGLRRVEASVVDTFAEKTWSQEGEDMILRRFFDAQPRGFYVDVGAHHPRRFSNTHALYRAGWSGVNVDAKPGAMRAFERERPRDRNVEAAVSKDGRTQVYSEYNDPALNTLKAPETLGYDAERFKVTAQRAMPTRTLKDILTEHVPAGQRIDLMSVDVEGMDLEVLEGNDWTRFRPRCVLVELWARTFDELGRSDLHRFLTGQGYAAFAKTINTVFYQDTRATT